MFRATKPSMRWEYPEVHLLNFAIFVATLFCFEFFWRELLASRGDKAWAGVSRLYVWVLGYLLFACVLFGADALAMVLPDLLVAALVLLSSGMMLRFMAGRMGTASALLLGILLGAGYLAKAAMLPFAFIAMTTMFVFAWRHHRRKSLIAASLLGFLSVAGPFVTALSLNLHRFTFGDSAKLNQGWYVNGVNPRPRHWQGDDIGHTDAQHPTRRVFAWPEVYEFATPVEGTYPPGYDPAYWYAGLDSSVHPVREAKALSRNMGSIDEYFSRHMGFLTAVLLMMCSLSGRVKDVWRQFVSLWPILVPAVAVFMMYAMVYWEQRYTFGMVLAGFGAVIASMSPLEEERRILVLRAASLTLGLMVVCWVLPSLMWGGYRHSEMSAQQVVVAERLRTMSIEPGDRVALIGDGFVEYWARLEKVRIVAEVPDVMEAGGADSAAAFWDSNPEIEQEVLNILRSTGAKAVVAANPPRVLPPGWVEIGNTRHAVYLFR
jgi:4-amino-4-deoxy-L-arabinose transferase-like glycosyltransferase